MKRLRDNPKLLDDIFQSLVEDDQTKDAYGEKQVAQAKQWFLTTNIPVSMSFRVDEGSCPIVTIGLQESTEAEQTHADVHYVPVVDASADWPALTDKFDVVQYAPSSGMIVLPAAGIGDLIPASGMSILDAEGRAYPIIEILDDYTVAIAPNTIADFHGAVLKGSQTRLLSTVESVNMRETYVVGCHVMSNSTYLTYLHSIVLYSLLKYKQELLEGRGLERTTLSSAEFRRNDLTQNELMFSRAIIINGYVRQSWRKTTEERIQATEADMVLEKPSFTGDADIDLTAVATDGWAVENND